jgi:excinuclease UvrABC helicase subunit UvrB
MSKAEKTKEINFLRKEMETAAKALNFIEAVRIRDLITELKK